MCVLDEKFVYADVVARTWSWRSEEARKIRTLRIPSLRRNSASRAASISLRTLRRLALRQRFTDSLRVREQESMDGCWRLARSETRRSSSNDGWREARDYRETQTSEEIRIGKSLRSEERRRARTNIDGEGRKKRRDKGVRKGDVDWRRTTVRGRPSLVHDFQSTDSNLGNSRRDLSVASPSFVGECTRVRDNLE